MIRSVEIIMCDLCDKEEKAADMMPVIEGSIELKRAWFTLGDGTFCGECVTKARAVIMIVMRMRAEKEHMLNPSPPSPSR